jgi:hypothetical protein
MAVANLAVKRARVVTFPSFDLVGQVMSRLIAMTGDPTGPRLVGTGGWASPSSA